KGSKDGQLKQDKDITDKSNRNIDNNAEEMEREGKSPYLLASGSHDKYFHVFSVMIGTQEDKDCQDIEDEDEQYEEEEEDNEFDDKERHQNHKLQQHSICHIGSRGAYIPVYSCNDHKATISSVRFAPHSTLVTCSTDHSICFRTVKRGLGKADKLLYTTFSSTQQSSRLLFQQKTPSPSNPAEASEFFAQEAIDIGLKAANEENLSVQLISRQRATLSKAQSRFLDSVVDWNGDSIITALQSERLICWNAKSGEAGFTKKFDQQKLEPIRVAIDPSETYIAVSCSDFRIHIYNISNKQYTHQKVQQQGTQGEQIKNILQIHTSNSDINSQQPNDKQQYFYEVTSTPAHAEVVTALSFTQNGRKLIVGTANGIILVYRLPPLVQMTIRQVMEQRGVQFDVEGDIEITLGNTRNSKK
ncbi:MAG: hypothetical protein EZS28_047436, partial [Streblomastix strix]